MEAANTLRTLALLLVLLLSASLFGCLLPGKSRASPSETASVIPSGITGSVGPTAMPTTTFIPATPSPAAKPEIVESTLREKALAYLKTEPQVESFKIFTWEEYFTETYLAKSTGKRLDYDWFVEHASFVKQGGDGLPIVYWQGLPGCTIDAAQTQDLQYGPKWYDENGKRCFTVWLVEVSFSADNLPAKVRISELE